MARPEAQAAELRHHMAEHRRELREAMTELREAAWSWTDVGDPIRERPVAWILGAMAFGWWVGWRRS